MPAAIACVSSTSSKQLTIVLREIRLDIVTTRKKDKTLNVSYSYITATFHKNKWN